MAETKPAEVRKEVWRKKRSGEDLTAEEEQEYRKYLRRRHKLSQKIYYEDERQAQEFKQRASQDGYKSVSKWFLDKAHRGSTGVVYDQSYVEGLKAKVEDLEAAKRVLEVERNREAARADMYEQQFVEWGDKVFGALLAVEEKLTAAGTAGPNGPDAGRTGQRALEDRR